MLYRIPCKSTAMKKIALEEHFMTPDMLDYWAPTMVSVPPALTAKLQRQLLDFGEERLSIMDEGEQDIAILSLAGPGIQAEPDPAVAVRRAALCNDELAVEIQKNPARYGGFAHLPMQDPTAAADELERCVRDLGLIGAMIDGQTHGHYMDEDQYSVFWERAEALDAPIYLHPGDPISPMPALLGHPKLLRATWEWGVETATHALRLVFSGTFDRYPGARLILGHLGETLPYLLWRFDSRVETLYGRSESMKLLPSEYIRRNITLTTSGMCSKGPLVCAIDAMGEDNIMFSVDYPFEIAQTAYDFMNGVDLPAPLKQKLAYDNAKRILKL
jgi:2,3-dihydroxybenzoate decarboxylase